MRQAARVIDSITTAFAIIAGVAVILLMLHVTIDVVIRAFGGNPPGTIIIVTNYYMLFLVCLPLALVERENAHINVDVLTNMFSAEAKRHVFGWAFLITALTFGLITYGSWIEAVNQTRNGKFMIEHGISFSTWIGYWGVPMGYGTAAIYALLKFIRYLLGQPVTPVTHTLDEEVERLGHD